MTTAEEPEAVDVAALRKVAEVAADANEGKPWRTGPPEPAYGHTPTVVTEVDGEDDEIAWGLCDVDAHHIVTFDPPTALALLDRLAEAEAKVARVEALVDDLKFRSCPCGLQLNAALTGGDR